jgi:5-hydroxyisourate hydrolase
MAKSPVISTHVLDTRVGRPASGLEVRLYTLEDDLPVLESTATTDQDGRISALSTEPLRPGKYRIVFDVASYAAGQGLEAGFFAALAADIDIRDVNRSYHVPLILSPHSCMTYLGS